MPALIIGETQRKQIAELRAIATANPMNAQASLNVANRDMEAYRDMMSTLTLELPIGYVVTYTHEIQPNAPPPGLCHHISISVTRPRKMPGTAAVEMILEEFGMRRMEGSDGLWIEDIDPVTKAINIVQTVQNVAQPSRATIT